MEIIFSALLARLHWAREGIKRITMSTIEASGKFHLWSLIFPLTSYVLVCARPQKRKSVKQNEDYFKQNWLMTAKMKNRQKFFLSSFTSTSHDRKKKSKQIWEEHFERQTEKQLENLNLKNTKNFSIFQLTRQLMWFHNKLTELLIFFMTRALNWLEERNNIDNGCWKIYIDSSRREREIGRVSNVVQLPNKQ